MKMPAFKYHRPATLGEATALLAEHGADAKVLAGGQSLLPLLALRLAHPEHLIDIGRVEGLARVDVDGGALVVGAGVRHAAAEVSSVVAAQQPLVAGAMPFIGHRAIRTRGTVCGSLAHADPAAELPAVALALEAEMTVASAKGERRVPAADFFINYLTCDVDETEILTGVTFPAWPNNTGWSLQEISRRHGDFALIGLAAVLQVDAGGTIERTVLSFFGAAATPVRVNEAEQLLIGERPDPGVFEAAGKVVSGSLSPSDDNHASGAYRAHVAGVLTRRSLAEAAQRAGAAA